MHECRVRQCVWRRFDCLGLPVIRYERWRSRAQFNRLSLCVVLSIIVSQIASSFALVSADARPLRIEIEHLFDGKELKFDEVSLDTVAGGRLSVTRLDYLLSELSLQRSDG